jgi:hypothetical protein
LQTQRQADYVAVSRRRLPPSLHDLVSFKIKHTICSRMGCITKENTIDRPSLELVQLLPFLKEKVLATKDMEVTHLGCATMHQLATDFLLVHSEVDSVLNIARGIDHLSPEPSRSPITTRFSPYCNNFLR